MALVIKHNLHLLTAEEVQQYLRDVSEYIGIDPNLNAFDTIWMPNEAGPGQSLVVYARRGTAEILRNLKGVEVDSLEDHVVNGSIVFRAKGHDKTGRHEIAIGSKHIEGLNGKQQDDAIMTASTRALRRLTMQFTTLGILDESEVNASKNETTQNTNPAGAAKLAGSPVVMPPLPTVAPNNAPGKDVTPNKCNCGPNECCRVCQHVGGNGADRLPAVNVPKEMIGPSVAMREADKVADIKAAEKAVKNPAPAPVSLAAPVSSEQPKAANNPAEIADIKADTPKRTRRKKNTVALDVEPETVKAPAQTTQAPAPVPPPQEPEPIPAPVPAQVNPAVPVQVNPAVAPAGDLPTEAQMTEYRKKIGVFTSQLPASEGMGSVQKMRAFITKMSGTAPQYMTVKQWNETLAWFDDFMSRNQIGGLIKYVNDILGVK